MGDLDRRPGATNAVEPASDGGAATTAVPPGRRSLTAPALPRTTADLGIGPVEVTADRLNVRKTPQVEPGNVVGGLEHGQVVSAIARNGDWLRIVFGVGPSYINKGFVQPMSKPTDARAPDSRQHADATTAQAESQHGASSSASGASQDGEFTTDSGNAIAKTTPAEAAVLNKVRRDPRRLNPGWLEAAQHALGVHDATGAMNTETLRAMREHAHQPKLDAAGIMSETFLAMIAPGKPFQEGTETGENKNKQPADTTATTPKDRAAQSLGYSNFQAYYDTWGEDAVTFLSKSLKTPAHPYLRARLQVAEAYLRNRVKSPDGQKLDDAGVRKAIGWNGEGNASYAHKPGTDDNMTHQHAMGLAIDVNPGQNPYFFDHSVANADFWVGLFERLFQYATRMYGGDALTAATMLKWSQESSSEELFPRIAAASQSFAKLLELSTRAHGDESPTGEIAVALTKAGYKGDELKTAIHEVAVADHHFHQQKGRKDAKQATNLTQELVIALRDVAGLAWGGTEMSMIENGDFMHFDCRLTDFGQSVYRAGAAAHKKAAT